MIKNGPFFYRGHNNGLFTFKTPDYITDIQFNEYCKEKQTGQYYECPAFEI